MRLMGILKSPYKHRNDMKMIPYLAAEAKLNALPL